MKINKLQAGGYATYTPIATPALQLPGASPQQVSNQQGGEEVLSKEVIKQLLENGLMNDVDLYVKQLNSIAGDLFGNPSKASQAMINHYPQINKIIQNKQMLTDAVKKANDNGGLSEYAITTTGQVIVRDEDGNLTQISTKELQEHGQYYQVLTNSDLVQLRQTDPSMAFNSNVYSTIENGVGPDKITDYILKVANKIGYDKATSDNFVTKHEKDISEGVEQLLQGAADEGIFKITQTTKTQDNKAQQALKYIYSVLPQNMRNYLKTQAAVMGQDPSQGSLELIATLMSSTLQSENTMSIDYDSAQSKAAGGGKSGSDKLTDLTQAQAVLSGKSTSQREFVMNQRTDFEFKTGMNWWSTPTDKNNNPINKSLTLEDLFTDSSFAGLVDTGSVYFGTQKVDESIFDRVVYNNADGFGVVNLPYIDDGQGHVTVDLELSTRLSEVQKEIKSKGAITEAEKKDIYDRHNMGQWYFATKDPEYAQKAGLLKPFVVFSGLSTDDDNIMDPNDSLLEISKSRNADTRIFEAAINRPKHAGGAPSDNYEVHQWYNHISGGNDILKGTIYVPLTQDAITTFITNKNVKVPEFDANFVDANYGSMNNRSGKIANIDLLN